MFRALGRAVRARVFGRGRGDTLSGLNSSPAGGRPMARRLVRWMLVLVALGGAGYGVYEWLWTTPQPPPSPEPEFIDNKAPLTPAEKFAELARTKPVGMLEECLKRYTREVKGFTATLEKQERVHGQLHDWEVIRVA